VRLVVMAPVHLDEWGVSVSTPTITAGSATVSVQSTLVNQATFAAPVTVQTTILGPEGQAVQQIETAQSVPAGQQATVQQQVTVPNPQLWNLDSPNLYHAWVKIYAGKSVIDDDIVTFGIREFISTRRPVLAEREELQDQGGLPACGRGSSRLGGAAGDLGAAAGGAEGAGCKCHPYRT
jgi:beta-galactosidase/beta-glucuronidase